MELELPTDTALLPRRDLTTRPEWIHEQVMRLAGFDLLRKLATADPTPLQGLDLSDKLGVYKGYPHIMLKTAAKRLANER
jgi:hypothetical protein